MATKPAGEEARVMGGLKRLVPKIDGWQRQSRVAGPAYGVVKKFSDDQASLLVVGLGWYGFLAIYPLMLVVVTVLGLHRCLVLGERRCKDAATVSGDRVEHQPRTAAPTCVADCPASSSGLSVWSTAPKV
jgi:hypothetical protein